MGFSAEACTTTVRTSRPVRRSVRTTAVALAEILAGAGWGATGGAANAGITRISIEQYRNELFLELENAAIVDVTILVN